ncbi:DUF4118 domain-containing protein [Glaciimonas immobilis]|uniref:K+-sensing histidine kinase KdpD n=1 Tax=Glaciimonas immobilis TaxID=728004 RepID=A0A840RLS4_9BURK|nr:DUF4118 domain-containing protein [Glaciimonas immobilis]KAF3999251.1 DUF4118 domain-containing protein [Glaciimonas immobilis]MBB5198713.1 K+-sensing histidine kinase KdpD [Glaciimonas immobilis]
MKLKNSRTWKQSGLNSIGICLLGFALTFCLRFVLNDILDESMSMLFFAINCIVMACFFGFWHSTGLLAISLPTAFYFFRKPYSSFEMLVVKDIYIIIIYATIILLASWIIEWLQRERYAAVLLQRVSETRYQLLIESDQARRVEQTRNSAA